MPRPRAVGVSPLTGWPAKASPAAVQSFERAGFEVEVQRLAVGANGQARRPAPVRRRPNWARRQATSRRTRPLRTKHNAPNVRSLTSSSCSFFGGKIGDCVSQAAADLPGPTPDTTLADGPAGLQRPRRCIVQNRLRREQHAIRSLVSSLCSGAGVCTVGRHARGQSPRPAATQQVTPEPAKSPRFRSWRSIPTRACAARRWPASIRTSATWCRLSRRASARFARSTTTIPSWARGHSNCLAEGKSPPEVLDELLRDDEGAGGRQLAIIDRHGRTAQHNPSRRAERSRWWGAASGRFYACQGNTLAGPQVITAMAKAYETTDGSLADRLMAALVAGDCAGGDHRGRLAAGIIVAKPEVEGHWLELSRRQERRRGDGAGQEVRRAGARGQGRMERQVAGEMRR